jgi:hypothetical protein
VALLALQSLLPKVVNAVSLTNLEWTIDGITRQALVHLPSGTKGASILSGGLSRSARTKQWRCGKH